MKQRTKSNEKEGSFEARMMGFFASLFFSIPTAFFLWVIVNREFAIIGSAEIFISSKFLWVTIFVFSIIAIINPDMFTYLIGRVWRFMTRLISW